MTHSLRRWLLAALLGVMAGLALPAASDQAPELALRQRHATLQDALANNTFGQALVLDSAQEPERLTGRIHAVIAHPFGKVRAALGEPAHWCAVLSLHANTKYCREVTRAAGSSLQVYMGTKSPQQLSTALSVDMDYRVLHNTPRYLAVALRAPAGPMGTGDTVVMLESIPLGDTGSIVSMTYSSATGALANMAMSVYLATAGRGKVGFSTVGISASGEPRYLAGALAAIERNTMRYYLAINAHLGTLNADPAQQPQARLRAWFDATERYPLQLHEMDWPIYLAMKLAEHRRQQMPP